MAAAGQLVIRIQGDSSRLEKALSKASKKMKAFEGAAKKVGIASAAIGAGILAVGFKAVRAAQAQQIGITKLDAALGTAGTSYAKMRDEIEALATSQQALTNFGDDQTRDMLTRMVSGSGDAAGSLKALATAQDLATHMTKQGGNAMRAQKTAAELVARALAGDVVGLRTYIPQVTAAMSATEALAMAEERFGGLAAAAADPVIQMTNDLGDLKEQIGNALLPAFVGITSKVAEFARTFNAWVKDNEALVNRIVVAVAALGGFLVVLGGTALMLALVSAGIRQLAMLGKVVTLVTWAWSKAQAALNLIMSLNPLGLLVLAIGALVVGVILAVKYWDKLSGVVQKAWDWFLKLSPPIKLVALSLALPLFPIIALIAGIVRLAKNWDAVWGAILRGFSFYTEGIKSNFQLGFGWLLPGGLLHKALSWLRGTLTAFWRRVSSVWDVVAGFLGLGMETDVEKFKEETESKWAVLKPVLDVGIGLASGNLLLLWKGLQGSWKLIDQTVQPLVVAVHWVADIAKGLWKLLGIAWAGLASTVLSIGAAFATDALTLWTLLKAGWDNLASRTLHPVLALVSGAAKALWDKLTEWWNALFSSGSSRRRAASTKNVLRIPAAAFALATDVVTEIMRKLVGVWKKVASGASTLRSRLPIGGSFFLVNRYAGKVIYNALKAQWDALTDTLTVAWDWATSAATSFAGTIAGTVSAAWDWAASSATKFQFHTVPKVGIVAAWRWAAASASAFAGKIAGTVTAAWDWAASSATDFVASITGGTKTVSLDATATVFTDMRAWLRNIYVALTQGALIASLRDTGATPISIASVGTTSAAALAVEGKTLRRHASTGGGTVNEQLLLLTGIQATLGLIGARILSGFRAVVTGLANVAKVVKDSAARISTPSVDAGDITDHVDETPKTKTPPEETPQPPTPTPTPPVATSSDAHTAWAVVTTGAWATVSTNYVGGAVLYRQERTITERRYVRTTYTDGRPPHNHSPEDRERVESRTISSDDHSAATGASGSRGARGALTGPVRRSAPVLAGRAAGGAANFNFNITVDTSGGGASMWQTFERDFRRMIRKLQREGLLPLAPA